MMNINVLIKKDELHLEYCPINGAKYIRDALTKNKVVNVKGVFEFEKNDLVSFDDYFEAVIFRLGKRSGQYWDIPRRILHTNYPVLIHNEIDINPEIFVGKFKVPIIRRLEEVLRRQVIIGGDESGKNIPTEVFNNLLKNFPSETEIKKYYRARIFNSIKNAVDIKKDAQQDLDEYVNKRQTIHPFDFITKFNKYELVKFTLIKNQLLEMLRIQDNYSEADWQRMIVEIFLLLNPKYVALLQKVRIPDAYKKTYREIDLVLIDTNGVVDIIEIKRAHFGELVSSNPGTRGNFLPQKSLSEAIIQAEKYLFHLNKYGKNGEEELTRKYESKLPHGIKIQIRNPKAIIIMGRTNDLKDSNQRLDFEIIKRHYSNVVDVISYDELVQRLDRIIGRFNM